MSSSAVLLGKPQVQGHHHTAAVFDHRAATIAVVVIAFAIPTDQDRRMDHVLRGLKALEIVRREIRFGDAPGSKNSAHRVADPFTTFWYRRVFVNRSLLRSQMTGSPS